MATFPYGFDGTDIFRLALAEVPVASTGSWPDNETRLDWLNLAIMETQKLTGIFRTREDHEFLSGATYYELTVSDPEAIRVVSVYDASNVPMKRENYETLRDFRANTADLGADVYAVAVNPHVVATPYVFGTVRFELYPVAPVANVTLELAYEDTPPMLASLSESPKVPANCLIKHVGWTAALARNEPKAQTFRQYFERLCMEQALERGVR